jgi:hypothetical protein
VKLTRVFDRDGDRYHELVTDPATGEELHRRDERLSQHRRGLPLSEEEQP